MLLQALGIAGHRRYRRIDGHIDANAVRVGGRSDGAWLAPASEKRELRWMTACSPVERLELRAAKWQL